MPPKSLTSVVEQDLLTTEERKSAIGTILVWFLKLSPSAHLLSLLPADKFEKQKHQLPSFVTQFWVRRCQKNKAGSEIRGEDSGEGFSFMVKGEKHSRHLLPPPPLLLCTQSWCLKLWLRSHTKKKKNKSIFASCFVLQIAYGDLNFVMRKTK